MTTKYHPVVDGVPEEWRCPECGRYDSSLGYLTNTSCYETATRLHEIAFAKDSAGNYGDYKAILCYCYDGWSDKDTCPHCDAELCDVYEYFYDNRDETNFDCPDCGKLIHGSVSISYHLESVRRWPPKKDED